MKLVVCLLTALTVTVANAQVVRLVKDLSGESVTAVAIDGTGTNVFAVASSNQYGTDPKYRNQIFRWDAASGAGTQLTNFELGVSSISISDDGQWLAFISTSDITGSNKDESDEVFVMHPDGTGLTQLTNDASLTGWGVQCAKISGSGNRIVFVADTDPLGTNPARTTHAFVVDREGANLVQIQSAEALSSSSAISDDGNRVVFQEYVPASNSSHILESAADGSSAPIVVATVLQYANPVSFSGNGGTIVYSEFTTNNITKVNWDGTGLISPLVAGGVPSITDDGLTVFYRAPTNTTIHKIGSDGAGDTIVSTPSPPLKYGSPVVSGDGSRIALTSSVGQIAGGSNPDGGVELLAMDASGGTQRQLTMMSMFPMDAAAPSRGITNAAAPRILSNGTRIYFTSNGDPLGANPDHVYQVFTILPTGTGLSQVTHLAKNANGGLESLSVSDAGIVVFEARTTCSLTDIFKINTNGTGLTQLTNVCAGGSLGLEHDPIVRFDGQWVIFEGVYNSVYGIYKISINGGAVSSVANTEIGDYISYRMSTIPISYVVFEDPGNLDGLNPSHKHQISRVAIAGGGKARIALDPAYDSYSPDISGDGSKIVWESQGDFVGENADHSNEIFLYDASTAAKRQLTHTDGISTFATLPAITRDGSWVYYGVYSGTSVDWLRQSVATGEVQRITGYHSGLSAPYYADVDGTGAKTVFTGANIIHESPNWTSLFLADQTAKPTFTVGKASPTYLTWDPDPQSVRYDVLRGDLADLSITSGTVSLGGVTCVEDDSRDNRTLGSEDATQPAPGQGFFYLYRGTTGVPALAGSWGQGTGGLERVAGVGSCNP